MCLAVPALVTELLPDNMAKISLDGVSMPISIALVKNVAVGDYVIVHVGIALSVMHENEALAIRDDLRKLLPAEQEPSP